MKKSFPGLLLALILLLSACTAAPATDSQPMGDAAGSDTATAYHKVTAEDAKLLMDDGEAIIVDVRRPDEYRAGHLPSAINIPNEDIAAAPPEALPDLDAVLIVYCRTGVRSKEASDQLVAMGYTNVNDMGGIVDWPYDTVTEE